MRQTFLYETNGDVDKLRNTIEEAGGKIIEVQSHYDTGKRIVFDAPVLLAGANLFGDEELLTLETLSTEIVQIKKAISIGTIGQKGIAQRLDDLEARIEKLEKK